jgi:hypothetical protein
MHKTPSPYKATWRQKAGRRERPSLTEWGVLKGLTSACEVNMMVVILSGRPQHPGEAAT